MKLVTKIVLVLLLIGLFLPLWLKDPTGQPLMTPADWARIPARALPAAGTGPTMDSSMSSPLPAGVSKEAIEQLLQDALERRMGEHL